MKRFVLLLILVFFVMPGLFAQNTLDEIEIARKCAALMRRPNVDNELKEWLRRLEMVDSKLANEYKREIRAVDKFKTSERLSGEDKFFLASAFEYGHLGMPCDLDRAVLLYEESVSGYRQGGEDVAIKLGLIGLSFVSDYSDYDRAYIVGKKAIAIGEKYGNADEVGLGIYYYTEWPGDDICAVGKQREARGELKDAFCCYYVGSSYGSGSATAELARCYADGIAVNRNIDMAYDLMVTATRMGYVDSERRSDAYARRINQRNAAIYAEKQRQEEEKYLRQRNASVMEVVAVGAVIAGIVALVGKAFTSSSSSSVSSSYSPPSYSSSSYSSSSSSSSSSYSICPDCSGRGMMNCIYCYGSGIIKGGMFSSDEVCFSCKGTGTKWCWHCGGKGSKKN